VNTSALPLNISLSFLSAGNYTAEIYSDAADAAINPKHTAISKQQVSNRTVLQAKLVTGGGYAVRITKNK
jgi:alpha-glucosidase